MSSHSYSGCSSLDELPIVRRLRQKIRDWWQIEVAFTNVEGYVLDHARGVVVPPHNALCRAELTSEDGFRRCNRSVVHGVAAALARASDGPFVDDCHLGFPALFVPVVRMGKSYGALFCGGFLVDDSEVRARREGIALAAWRQAVKVEDEQDAIDSIPLISLTDLGYLRDLMAVMADEVAVFMSTDARRDESQLAAEASIDDYFRFANIVGRSSAMHKLSEMVARVASSESTVLITGENGTGKELVARAIHFTGPRREGAFVVINCSALNDNLLENELFGSAKGAFTGAVRDRKGLFEVADKGTIFLDEVGDMSPAMQVKVLRVLQHGTFNPVGDTNTRTTDVRVVAATHRPIREMVKDGRFREDLFYRVNVINLHIPPLRERTSDLAMLCEHFLDRLARRTNTPRKQLGAGVLERFMSYSWPGNIRELENQIERLHVLSGESEVIETELLSEHIGRERNRVVERAAQSGTLAEATAELERHMIAEGLVREHWNKSRLAEALGISRTTLIKKVREYGLDGPEAMTRA